VSKAKVIFHQCIQDSQEYGSDDEHMVSRIFFILEIGEERFFLLSYFFKTELILQIPYSIQS